MRYIRNAIIALMAMGGAALIGSTAIAQAPYGYYDGPGYGSYYSYGAGRADPSISPNGWDLGNPRDFQLRGRN
jgi:hypothetical protein